MNLASTISIYAGGPGSGCKGSKCGRPAKKFGALDPSVTGLYTRSGAKKNLEEMTRMLIAHDFDRGASVGGYSTFGHGGGGQYYGQPTTWTRMGKEEVSPNAPGETKRLGERFRSHRVTITQAGWHHTSRFGFDYQDHGRGLSAESLDKNLKAHGL